MSDWLLSAALVLASTTALVVWFRSNFAWALIVPIGVVTGLSTRPLAVHLGPYGSVRATVLYLTSSTPPRIGPMTGLSEAEIDEDLHIV
jgi:hypothetical protein